MQSLLPLLPAFLLACQAGAQSSGPSSATGSVGTAASPATTTMTTTAVSTASPTSTLAPTQLVGTEPLPAVQDWCLDPIYCSGQEILQAVQLARVFPDSKTFPDKPTRFGVNRTIGAFQERQSDGNLTYAELESFLNDYFLAEGTELVPVSINSSFNASATPFLQDVDDELFHGFVVETINIWSDLIRETNTSVLCSSSEECDSSLIPLNHTAVVAGGRYREVYYWDSAWILEGLLYSGLPEYARDILENFMDEIATYGFIPNGARKYYLNRSQPPVFTQMVAKYVEYTNDTSILERALPLADAEFEWWSTNRTLSVTSPYTNTSYDVARFDVFVNTAPRPEGYVEDWETVHYAQPALNQSQAEDLYAELASGAESGWDYSSRWCKEPLKNLSDPLEALRSLNVRNIIPVDLNAILTANHFTLADLYDQYASVNSSTGNNATARANLHRQQGEKGKAALFDLMWDADKVAYYDFNTTSNERSDRFTLAGFYPYWLDIIPPEVETNETVAQQAFSGINYLLARYNGSLPATLINANLNWDLNAWPPHQYIVSEGLANLPENVTTTAYSALVSNGSLWSLIPEGQLGLNETDLPPQPGLLNPNATIEPHEVENGTNWRDALELEVVQRYMESAFCSWYSTGGNIPGLLQALPADQLNVTSTSAVATGLHFEKFDATQIDAAGGGGEYEVVTGFGWTNGVIIYYGAKYGQNLTAPDCPAIAIQQAGGSNTTSTNALPGSFDAVGAGSGSRPKYAGSRVPIA